MATPTPVTKENATATATAPAVAPPVEDMAASLKAATNAGKVTEVAPNVAAVEATPLNIEDLTEADITNLPELEARPLGFGDALNVKPIDKMFVYRWINIQSQRFAGAKAAGWTLAQPADVHVAEEAIQDDKISLGDVVLMKMPKLRYLQAIKANVEKAKRRERKETVAGQAIAEGEKTINSINGPKDYIRQKVSVYTPNL